MRIPVVCGPLGKCRVLSPTGQSGWQIYPDPNPSNGKFEAKLGGPIVCPDELHIVTAYDHGQLKRLAPVVTNSYGPYRER